jgi:hypothetical protein
MFKTLGGQQFAIQKYLANRTSEKVSHNHHSFPTICMGVPWLRTLVTVFSTSTCHNRIRRRNRPLRKCFFKNPPQ